MATDTIKEFLVGLGFKVNENSLKKFNDGIANATKRAAVLATAVTGAAVAVGAAVTKMADHMEKLYYASQRTGATVQSLQAFTYAAGQMGVAAESSRGSVEGLANFMRSTPSSSKFIESLGVATQDANGKLRDTTEILMDLGQKFKDMPYYRAKVYASALGIDEETLRGLINGMGEFSAIYQEMYKKAGVDSQAAAKQSRTFMNELRTLGTAFDLLWQKISMGLLKVLTPFVKQFRERVMDNFKRIAGNIERALDVVLRIAGFLGALAMRMVQGFVALDEATGGWSTALAAALVAWRALNLGFMLTPIGAIITAIVALGAAIVALVDDYQTWKEGGLSLIDWSAYEPYIQKIKSAVVTVFEWYRGYLKFVIGGILDAFKALRDWFEDFINWFKDKWDWIEDKASKAQKIAGKVADGVSEAASTVKEKAGQVMSSITESEPAKKAMSFFQKMGWSKEQSAGLAANIQAESGGRANAVGDNGKAYGIAQWHPDRQKNFEKWAGKRIQDSTYEEQLAFMHYELTEGTEKRAGDRLKGAGTAAEAGAAVSQHYERPADKLGEAAKRAKGAEVLLASATLSPSPATAAQLQAANTNAQISQTTSIVVQGSGDPNTTAQSVARTQDRVNSDMVRNLKGAVVG